MHFDEISLHRRVAVSALLRHSRVSRAQLLTWNPALSRRAAWLPKGYRLKAPKAEGHRFRTALSNMGPTPTFPYHVVSRGDTLSELAKIYGTSTHAIQSINGLRSAHRLLVGQRLEIPRKSSVKAAAAPAPKRRPARVVERSGRRDGSYHVVSRGDTLWEIAQVYGISARVLQSVNGLVSVRSLQVGQRLEIPDKSFASQIKKRVVKKQRLYHLVRRGETLSAIADRYRVSPAAIQRANGIRNRHRIRAGQRLRIPAPQS